MFARFLTLVFLLTCPLFLGTCATSDVGDIQRERPNDENEDTDQNNDNDNDNNNSERLTIDKIEKLFGLHVGFSNDRIEQSSSGLAEEMREHINWAVRTNAQVIRLPGDWRMMQPDGPENAEWYIELITGAVRYAQSQNLKVIMLFAQTPCWALDASIRPADDPATTENEAENFCNDRGANGAIWHPPSNPQNFANAMASLVQEMDEAGLTNTIIAWEVWNEPNSRAFWTRAGINLRPIGNNETANVLVELDAANEYTRLLNAAYNAIKAVDQDAIVLGGSLASADHDYLNRMLERGARFDALAIHPYVKHNPATNLSYEPEECPATDPLAPPWCYVAGVENIRRTLRNHNYRQKIWLTEFGYSSDSEPGGTVTQAEQSRMNLKLYNYWLEWDDVPVAIYYRLFDDEVDPVERFGLYTINHLPKATLTPFRATAARAAEIQGPID